MIEDPEIIEQLKALFFQGPKSCGNYGSLRYTTNLGNELILDDGKNPKNEVIKAANDFIDRNSGQNQTLTIVSSWFPDACYLSKRNAARNGAKIKITTLKPFTGGGKGGVSELPFSVTKLFSAGLSNFQ